MPQSKRGDDRKAGKALPDRNTKSSPGRTPGQAEGTERDVSEALQKNGGKRKD